MVGTTRKRGFREPYLKNGAVNLKQVELESWRRAALTMATLALVVFVFQRFVARAFDVVFEICIFYVPAGTVLFLYVYFKSKLRRNSTKPSAQAWLL